MMATLATFRASLRNLLSDKTQFTDSLITAWIRDGIKDYSRHFPRLASQTIAMTTGTKSYSLAAYDVLLMRFVEYPAGETPRRRLLQLPRTNYAFDGGKYYDIKADNSLLYMGENPTTGQSMIIEYDTLHTDPSSDATILTVPDEDSELIRLYVVWKAITQLELDENVSIDRKRDMMNALGLNAFRAERAYRYRLRDLQNAYARGSIIGTWKMDINDGIY